MDTLDRTLDALANPHRRQVLDRLATGALSTPALLREVDISKQAFSRHLAVLEAAGLVERTMTGRSHELRLTPEPLTNVGTWVDRIQRGWEANGDRLGRLLASLDHPHNHEETANDETNNA